MKGLTNAGGGVPHGSIGTPELMDSAVTSAKIAANAVSTEYTATIPANGWVEHGAFIQNDVAVQGITEYDNPIVDLNLTNQPFATKVLIVEQYQKVMMIWTKANKIEVYAETAAGAPDLDLPIHILCIRK